MAVCGGLPRAVPRPVASQAGLVSSGCEGMAHMSAPSDELSGDFNRDGVPRLTLSRRAWLVGGSVAAALIGAGLVRRWRSERASVFIAKNQSYRSDLVRTIQDGLAACGFVSDSIR